MTLPPALIQAFQVLTVALAAPLVMGVIARVEARLQGRRGPRVLQPYYDIVKAFGKEALLPAGAGVFFLIAPLVSFACYLAVPMMIPVLTYYGLPFAYTGDILGGGIVLAFGSFVGSVAAAQSGGVYAQLGSSRSKSFGAIAEPAVLLIVFGVAMMTHTDLPYAMAATVVSGPAQLARPAHLMACVALFLVVLYETGRIPVETHTGTIEFGMIEKARSFEHSGPYYAIATWGSAAKQFVFYVLLINVFVAPWGLAGTQGLGPVLLAVAATVGKALLLGVVIAVIDDSFAKLRLMKNTELLVAAFLLAIVGVFALYLGGG